LLLFVSIETLILLSISWFGHKGWRLPNLFKFGYILIEISFPSLLMLYMIEADGFLLSIDSPVVILYFLVIILSTLHLNFSLCLFTALLASIEYAALVYFKFHYTSMVVAKDFNLLEISFYIRCLLIILCGACAGYVALEIKTRIKSVFALQKSKNEIELIFGQQVSEEVAQALLEQGDSARKMEVTIMALDIRDFTTFAEKHTPNEILDFQNKIFAPILEIIRKHQGIVNQILGDGIMACFGAPVPNLRHAERGFQAGLDILEKVKELSRQRIIPATRLGIGLHAGEIITGNIGNAIRKQFSFSGTTVIIAFRVEQLNKEVGSQFLITGAIQNKLSFSNSDCRYIGIKALKGLDKTVDIYQVR